MKQRRLISSLAIVAAIVLSSHSGHASSHHARLALHNSHLALHGSHCALLDNHLALHNNNHNSNGDLHVI